MRGVSTKQPSLNEVAGGGRLRSLGKVQDQRSLLRGESDLALAELHRAPRGVELESPELVAARPAGAAFDQAGGQVGVDVRHRDVALHEVRAGS